jgi:Fic family protein
MPWIWQHKKWPSFEYDAALLVEYEQQFYTNAGIVMGAVSHLQADNSEQLKIDILTQEAVSTSGIEGEILQRARLHAYAKRRAA